MQYASVLLKCCACGLPSSLSLLGNRVLGLLTAAVALYSRICFLSKPKAALTASYQPSADCSRALARLALRPFCAMADQTNLASATRTAVGGKAWEKESKQQQQIYSVPKGSLHRHKLGTQGLASVYQQVCCMYCLADLASRHLQAEVLGMTYRPDACRQRTAPHRHEAVACSLQPRNCHHTASATPSLVATGWWRHLCYNSINKVAKARLQWGPSWPMVRGFAGTAP